MNQTCRISTPLNAIPTNATLRGGLQIRHGADTHTSMFVTICHALALVAMTGTVIAAERLPAIGNRCEISEFRDGALSVHAPAQRNAFAGEWLKNNVGNCSAAQLKAIVGNRAIWLGTADTAAIANLVDAALERRSNGSTEQFQSSATASPRPGSSQAAQISATPAGPKPPPQPPAPPGQGAAPPYPGNPQPPAYPQGYPQPQPGYPAPAATPQPPAAAPATPAPAAKK